jgi:hypothetical protein
MDYSAREQSCGSEYHRLLSMHTVVQHKPQECKTVKHPLQWIIDTAGLGTSLWFIGYP